MTDNTSAPQYALRGLQLIGWRDMQHALNYLFADGELRQERWSRSTPKRCWR